MKAEVVVREDVNAAFVPSSAVVASATSTNNTPAFNFQEHPVIIVRAEEVLLVVLVLMIWVAAIALFFNRWGKIRMLEPYQPKFEQAHRPSCPIAVDTAVNTGCSISDLRKQRMSFSKFNVNCLGDPLYSGLLSPRPAQRLRQNSVFVGSPTMTFLNPPRRVKSATDIHHLILGEGMHKPRKSLSGFSSIAFPMENSPSKEFTLKDRKPSITIERPPTSASCTTTPQQTTPVLPHTSAAMRRRPSTCHEFSCYFPIPRRRPSCFSDYKPTIAYGRVSKFKSFDQPSCSWDRTDRRLSTAFERSPTKPNRSRPSISLERPISWDRRPSVTIEPPSMTDTTTPSQKLDEQKPKLQKQTTINFENINPPYISLNKNSISLDQATTNQQVHVSYDRRPSFTLEQPSPIHDTDTGNQPGGIGARGKHRLSVSLDQAASKWVGNTPTFMIERATPVSPNPPNTILSSTSIELQLLETETESKQITNV